MQDGIWRCKGYEREGNGIEREIDMRDQEYQV